MKWRALIAMMVTMGIFGTIIIFRPGVKPTSHWKQAFVPPPHPLAIWPWPAANKTVLRKGVTRWYDTSAADGTTLDLLEFEFDVNPRLRFELYDQDEDHDNLADYYDRSVAHVVRDLNAQGRGPVIAAWNGPFFAYDRSPDMGPNGKARHVGPVVTNGVVRHNVGNPRWTFGVSRDGRFKVLHQPDRSTLAREFAFASAGLQCLIKDGRLLRLAPYPAPDAPLPRQPVPSTPDEAGHIPLVDHMRTSRTSLGWTADSRKLYLLVVNEPDHEVGSKLAVKRGEENEGGWTLDDLQRFWRAFGVPNAINSDGGAVTQFTFRLPDGRYDLLPPRLTSPNQRLILDENSKGAPKGGTLMSFLITERGLQPGQEARAPSIVRSNPIRTFGKD